MERKTFDMDFTSDIFIQFERTDPETVDISFINTNENKGIGIFEVHDTDYDWFDDNSVCDFLANDVIIEVMSNLVLLYSKDYGFVIEDVCDSIANAAQAFKSMLRNPSYFAQYIIDLLDLQPIQEESEKASREDNLSESNRIGNNEFVPDYIDQFLEDVAQQTELFDYGDIIAFERDVFAPNDKNVRALKKLYKQAHEAEGYEDVEEVIERTYFEVASIVKGVVDYEDDGSNY